MNNSAELPFDLKDPNWKEFSPDFDSLPLIEAYIEQQLEDASVDFRSLNKINISVDEFLTNIVTYSHATTTKVLCQILDTQICISLQDNGIPYNPLLKENPDVHATLEEREIGGLGIFMAKKLVDDLQYHYMESNNITTLILYRKK